MSDELKPLPCPFCGSERVTVEAGDGFKWRVAGCCACGALAGEVRLNTFMVDRAAAEAEATRRAIEEWNARSDDTLRTQLAAMTAERDQWRCLLDNVIRMHPDADDDGNAPGHSHSKPGIWDDDNKPAIRGTACQWCHVWNVARNALEQTR